MTRRLCVLLHATLLALLPGGCASVVGGGGAPPAPVERGWSETGIASWYGHPFHGRMTASGETYDMDAPTAAHKTLPFGARVRIDNLDNGRSTTLTVNDRGPFVRGRIIDVSRRGAEELGMVGSGTARVRITVLEAPVPCWEIQTGAFRERSNAEAERDRLMRDRLQVRIDQGSNGIYLVRVGPYRERSEVDRVRRSTGGVVMNC